MAGEPDPLRTRASDAETLGLPGEGAASVEVPGYRVEGELGRGGIAVVFRAFQEATGRHVALKVLRDLALADDVTRARFRREAQAAVALEHPNIVQVYEVGEHQKILYLAMEYAAGGSLDRKRAEWPMPPRQAAALIECLARAVGFAHDRGFIHRDLKPGNVVLTADGVPKITDFGLAKRFRSEEMELTPTGGRDLTQSGAVLGTPSYMAPEQASGDAKNVGPEADIWALGAILYALLAGRPPFKGLTVVETLDQVRHRAPPPLPEGGSPALAAVCLQCLRKEPADRYASAATLADDLRRYLTGQAVTLGVPEPAVPSGAISYIMPLPKRITEPPPDLGALAAHPAHAGSVRAAAFSPDGSRILTCGDDGAACLWSATPDGFVYGPIRRLEGHGDVVWGVAFSPDGSWAVTAGHDRTVRLWDLAGGGGDRVLTRLRDPAHHAAFAPDGLRVAFSAADKAVRVVDLDGRPVTTYLGHNDDVWGVTFTPDGTKVVSAGSDGTLRSWDAATGRHDRRFGVPGPVIPGCVPQVALSPNGRWVTAAGPSDVIRVWVVDTARELRRLEGHAGRATAVAFSGDGERILSGGRSGALRLWDATTGRVLCRCAGHEGAVWSVAFAPGRRFAVSGGADGKLRIWRLPDPTT